jgi:hypothetical protein
MAKRGTVGVREDRIMLVMSLSTHPLNAGKGLKPQTKTP